MLYFISTIYILLTYGKNYESFKLNLNDFTSMKVNLYQLVYLVIARQLP